MEVVSIKIIIYPLNLIFIGIFIFAILSCNKNSTDYFEEDQYKILFTIVSSTDEDIYTIYEDGTQQTQLTNLTQGDCWTPAWSPDGPKIPFSSHSNGLDYQLFVMNPDSSQKTNLTNDTTNTTYADYSWSPDGSQILYRADSFVFIMNSDGTGKYQVTDSILISRLPRWSPDGTKILFLSVGNQRNSICTLNPDGTNLQTLTETEDSAFPVWSPDGKRILYSDNNQLLYIINADGSGKRKLTPNPESTFERYQSWSPRKL